MKFVSLFAGVGGFDLGFERAGWECVGQVEIDKHARSVLDKHWPDVVKHDDVVTAREWADECGLVGNVDVVCGGFPCQPFSVAGKRLGRDDLRGNLFWNALEFTLHVKAQTLILENVPGLLTSDQGRTFGEIISDLAQAGFAHVEWRVVDSQFFGVAQRRKRVFIVASSRDFGGRPVLVEREGLRWDPAPCGTQGPESAAGAEGGAGGRGTVADSLSLARMQAFGQYVADGTASSIKARDYKDATDLVVNALTANMAGGGGGVDDNTRTSRTSGGDVVATLNSGGNSGGFRTEPGEHLVVVREGPQGGIS